MKVGLAIAGTLLGLILIGIVLFLMGIFPRPETPVSSGTEPTTLSESPIVEVPIEVKGADNVGGMQLELVYDEARLELQEVRTSGLASNALVETNLDTPGRLKLGLVDASGISGDGSVVTVIFLPSEQGGRSSANLDLVNVQVSDIDLRDLVVQSSSGRVIGASVTPPTIDLSR